MCVCLCARVCTLGGGGGGGPFRHGLLITQRTNGGPPESAMVAARSEHHVEVVVAAPRLEGLSQLLPVCRCAAPSKLHPCHVILHSYAPALRDHVS